MDVPAKNAPRLFLIDAYALIYRAFYAFGDRPLTNAKGENTSAPFGVAAFLHDILEEHRPDYLAVVFDAGRSHREVLYPEYKATRKKMPAELRDSLPRVRELVEAFRGRVVEVEGWEADDVIGTLAAKAVGRGLEAVIVSGDKDFYQLVSGGVRLLNPGRRGASGVATHWVDEENAAKKFGVPPARVVDYLALVGDSSDNVPGAPGIGPKTAVKLLDAYGTVEAALDHAEEVKAKRVRESLVANREQVLLSKELVTIRTDMAMEVDFDDLRVSAPDAERLRALYVKLEFRTLLGRLGGGSFPTGAVAGGGRTGIAAGAQYEVVSSVEGMADMVRACREAGTVGVAVLTQTLEPARGGIAGLALAPEAGRAFYLPVGHDDSAMDLALGGTDDLGELGQSAAADIAPDQVAPDQVPQDQQAVVPNLPPLESDDMAPLRELLADPAVVKVGHDLKRSLVACRRVGVALAGPLKDAMVASYVLDPGRRRHDLAALSTDFLGFETTPSSKATGKGRKRRDFGDVPTSPAARDFACEQADLPLRLWERFAGELAARAPEMQRLFDELETPLIPVLAEMELAGVGIDAAFFTQMSARLEEDLRLIREEIYRVGGADFNINSTPQLREVLFERLKLPILKRTKTGPSTDSTVLEELAAAGHELPRLLMDYRQLEKLRGTYVDALPALADPKTRRIHTTFNQTVAATGRLSSSDPNLQNIPVRTDVGREIRRGFVAAPGTLLLTADYSQIELRVLAHYSADPVFVRAFREEKDIHRETAAVVFDVAVEDVSGQMRDQAKTVNFATIYGQGPFSLGRRLGISMGEAKAFIAAYFERFAGVRRYLDEQVERAKETGYVETLMGRRRRVPELWAKSWNVRQFGERVACNTPIQGTAADLIKVAMIRLADILKSDPGARMLLQVHDELVLEVAEDRVPEVAATVTEVMESAMQLDVPLRVDTGSGKSWYDCKG